MKIAYVNQIMNFGGGTRYDRMLIPALKKTIPNCQITYFANEIALKREGSIQAFQDIDVKVVGIRNPLSRIINVPERINTKKSLLEKIRLNFRQKLESRFYTEVKKYDLAFFSWPYYAIVPNLSMPIVCIPHDFNYKHFFGQFIYSPNRAKYVHDALDKVLHQAQAAIVSSDFMRSEFISAFPQHEKKIETIYIAPLADKQPKDLLLAQTLITKFNIKEKYLLYPCNLMVHKNVAILFSALNILKTRGHSIKLILTGPGTELICGNVEAIGITNDFTENWDVKGLGYVANDEMDALIQCAEVIVTPSIYEAAPGPGMEAWLMGVPLAMSNLPFFTDFMNYYQTYAEVFDPLNALDIADKIEKIIINPERYRDLAKKSKHNMQYYSPEKMAQKYMQIFEKAIQTFHHK